MRVVHTQAELRGSAAVAGCVVVPTMGALHAGHYELVREAARLKAQRGLAAVIVWVFVNPTQFNDEADLARYPRTLEKDAEGCRSAGMGKSDVVFAPSVEEVYPKGNGGRVRGMGEMGLPRVATEPGLEDARRPGHFAGVCQVVKRLFEMVGPRVAVFGEKDWQQLQVIRAMVAQERMGIDIVGVPTVREPDGLAMSSRNVFLSSADREKARAMPMALEAGRAGKTVEGAERAMREVLERAGMEVEYAVVRDAETLVPAPNEVRGERLRMLIAARVGSVRLIDNAEWRSS